MIKEASWIKPIADMGYISPQFEKIFEADKPISRATLTITAAGVYNAELNGTRVGDFILAPGWTSYDTRLQYQTYDITQMLKKENKLTVTVGAGWYRSRINCVQRLVTKPAALIAEIVIDYTDQTTDTIYTDETWTVCESAVRFTDIYDGETYDASAMVGESMSVTVTDEISKDTLIPQEGEIICEHERIKPQALIRTPKGERVLDFGQEITGYVEFCVNAKSGDRVEISHAEVLDKDGNFYTANYRSSKSKLVYICRDGEQTYKPQCTFFGFRYIRLDSYPTDINLENFTAIAVYSDIQKTGSIACANEKLNKLFSNVQWSQRDNFLDVPTDCPQRDERLGWTGDAEVFAKTAAYNYDVSKFFKKWLRDIGTDQAPNGAIPPICPYIWGNDLHSNCSAAWGDVITIIPLQMYRTYGDIEFLKENFDAMKGWLRYIEQDSTEEYLWCAPEPKRHYGDWLALDKENDVRGETSHEFIASAFYANSIRLVILAGKELGEDVSGYEALYKKVINKIKATFTDYNTQTACVLALVFDLTDDKAGVAKLLAEKVKNNGNKLQTGFVGTPHLLHALSENGYCDVAYDLLCQEEYPSWLFAVNMGATTIWEHWDGIKEDGTFWDDEMNSYNHYAYGSVMDWVYSVSAGINPDIAGYKSLLIEPHPSKKIGWLSAEFESREGMVKSKWVCDGDTVRYEITVPAPAKIVIDDKCHRVGKGSYIFYGKNMY